MRAAVTKPAINLRSGLSFDASSGGRLGAGAWRGWGQEGMDAHLGIVVVGYWGRWSALSFFVAGIVGCFIFFCYF